MQPVAPLTIHLKPSRRLLVIQVAAHLLAAVAVLTAAISGWIAALLLAALGYSFSRVRNARLPAFIVLHGDGRLEKVGADGTATEAQVHPHTLVLAELIVLLCRQQGRIGALALLGDSLSAADARELRLWLRWRAQETRAA
jgi:hypothetical protein